MVIYSKKNGFTLIELLVVISIISLLSSVVLASLNSARSKARDSQRIQQIRQIQLAIKLYYDNSGNYPPSGGATAPNSGWSNSSDSSWTTLETALKPYIPNLSKDPQQTTNTSIWAASSSGPQAYSYINCGSTYMLVYQLETAKGTDPGSVCGVTPYQYGGGGANTFIKTVGDF